MSPLRSHHRLLAMFCLVVSVDSFATPQPMVRHMQNNAFLSMSTTPTNNGGRRWWTRVYARRPNPIEDATAKNRVLVKNRPRVQLDRDTGRLVEVAPAATGEKKESAWNVFKRNVYNTADALSPQVAASRVVRKPKPPTTLPTVQNGYGSTIEDAVLKGSLGTPGERLMREYDRHSLGPINDTPEPSFFDDFKEGIYSTVDGVANMVQDKKKKAPPKRQEMFTPIVKPSMAKSPEIRQAMQDLQSSNPGKRWLADFKIRNWKTEQERRQRDYERQMAVAGMKEFVFSVSDAVMFCFATLVALPQRLQEAAEATRAAAAATVEWMTSIPAAVDNTVKTITAIPTQISQGVSQVQETVTSGVETTKQVVETVQAIPEKVVQTVEGTKKTVDDTVTNVKVLVGAEKPKPIPPKTQPPPEPTPEDIAIKVAAGLAELGLKTAWWVTVGVAKVSFEGAKMAVTKLSEEAAEQRKATATAASTTQAARVMPAVKQATKLPETQMATPQKVSSKPVSSKPVSSKPVDIPKTPVKATVVPEVKPAEPQKSRPFQRTGLLANRRKNKKQKKPVPESQTAAEEERSPEMVALDKEVSEALNLAEKAMKMADEGREKKSNGETELDRALRLAREAALKATQEAVEIERNMRP